MGIPDSHHLPHVPAWFQSGFHGFLRPFLRRHFHAVGVDQQSNRYLQALSSDQPLIVYGNHPSWWDPLIAHFLNRTLFPERQFFAPIDADALEQYRVFAKLGFYGVKLQSTSGAAAFLKRSKSILNTPGTAIWLTPEGRFCDVRDHSARLMPGLAHLCTHLERGSVLPLALEYVFWDERLPVCLVRFGVPLKIEEEGELGKAQWNEVLHDRLRSTQLELAECVMERSSERFDDLIGGKAGAGFLYDFMRRLASLFSGKRFQPQHGEQFK